MGAAATGSSGLRHNHEYVRYRVARLVSLLGSQLSWLAFPLLVLAIGGGPARAGLVVSCALGTRLGCQLPAGYLADRFARRTSMICADLLRMTAFASIPLAAALDSLTYPQLLAIAVIEGGGTAVFSASATALLRDIVPAEQFSRAVGQTQATAGTMALIGPALGGMCFALSRILPFILDAASYLISAVLLAGLMARPVPMTIGNMDRQVTAGLRWLRNQPQVLRMMVFAAVINLSATAAQTAMVVELRERGTPGEAIGVMMACAGAGGVAGAACARRIIEHLDATRLCLGLGAAWVAGFAAFAAMPAAWVVGPALALLFFLSPAGGITLALMTVGRASHHLLGRVTTAQQLLAGGLSTAGPLLAGLGLRVLGASPVWLLLAGLCLVATTATMTPTVVAREPPRSGAPTPSGQAGA